MPPSHATMPPSRDPDPAEWTVETLRHHMERIFDEHELRYGQRFDAQQDAARLADDNLERRLDHVNEFRAQLRDVIATLMPRAETEARLAINVARLDFLADEHRGFITRTELAEQVNHLTARVQELSDRANRDDGRNRGFATSWAVLIAAVGAVIGITAIVVAILH